MAKINFIIGEMRGKLGGMVFSRNRFGGFARSKVTPVNPASERQRNARSLFATATINWSSLLSQGERDQWNAYADGTPVTDVFGNSITWPGFLWYVRTYCISVLAGNSAFTTPPTTTGVAALQSLTQFKSALALLDLNSDPHDAVTFDATSFEDQPGWDRNESGDTLLFYISKYPLKNGSVKYDGPWYYIGSVVGNMITPPGSGNHFDLDFEIKTGQIWNVMWRRIDSEGKTSSTLNVNISATTVI